MWTNKDQEPGTIIEKDQIIAKAICPRGKGWAWDHRTHQALDFTDPVQMPALLGWAQYQPWWNQTAYGRWNLTGSTTWAMVHQAICLDAAEKKAPVSKVAWIFRDMVHDAITQPRST